MIFAPSSGVIQSEGGRTESMPTEFGRVIRRFA
jgi:hypothetical protein